MYKNFVCVYTYKYVCVYMCIYIKKQYLYIKKVALQFRGCPCRALVNGLQPKKTS